MEEKVFLDYGGVSVSNARFIVHGQTYAMNGVTSVKQSVIQPSRFFPIILLFAGLIAVLGSGKSMIFGVALILVGILWLVKQKPTWVVVLNSASGEAQALSSQDRAFIDSVIGALNQSIVHRG